MKSLNFFCIGAQKAGTTTLFHMLNQHPDIYIPASKEAHYFDNDKQFELGYEKYWNQHFSGYANQKIIGTITPSYAYISSVPGRIRASLTNKPKFIFILRNPVERAWSHYLMMRYLGKETLSFEEALKIEESRIQQSHQNNVDFSYLNRGYYTKQIENYLQYFPREQLLVLIFETDFILKKEQTLNMITDFLEISPFEFELDIRKNQFKQMKNRKAVQLMRDPIISKIFKPIIPSKDIRKLARKAFLRLNTSKQHKPKLSVEKKEYFMDHYFNDELIQLEQFLGKDLNCWRINN